MFKNYLYLFRAYFTIERDANEAVEDTRRKRSKNYSWNDSQYSSFMVAVMQSLEPRKFHKNDLILLDLDEVDEVLFICSGEYGVGYTLNN